MADATDCRPAGHPVYAQRTFDAEATRKGGSGRDLDLMPESCRYDEVDCRVTAELVGWLRETR